MGVPDRSAAEAAQRIADALEGANIPHAIGGALALAIAGVPRGTADVDVNVFVGEDQVGDVVSALAPLGIEFDIETAEARAREEGMFVGRWDGMRIDLFMPSIPFSYEAKDTRIRITDSAGWSGWFLSAEALTLFKLLFFRGKDIVDLERLVAARPELDRTYVRRWLVEMMGEDDERTRTWDEIVARFGGSS